MATIQSHGLAAVDEYVNALDADSGALPGVWCGEAGEGGEPAEPGGGRVPLVSRMGTVGAVGRGGT